MQYGGLISDFRFPILFGISLLLKCNKTTHASISSPHLQYFYFFFLTTWFPQILHKATSIIPKKSKIEIKFNLEILFYRYDFIGIGWFDRILFYTVFTGELQKLHPFKSSRLEMFYKWGVLKNFAKFTGKHLYQSLIHYNVASCCFCSLSGVCKR